MSMFQGWCWQGRVLEVRKDRIITGEEGLGVGSALPSPMAGAGFAAGLGNGVTNPTPMSRLNSGMGLGECRRLNVESRELICGIFTSTSISDVSSYLTPPHWTAWARRRRRRPTVGAQHRKWTRGKCEQEPVRGQCELYVAGIFPFPPLASYGWLGSRSGQLTCHAFEGVSVTMAPSPLYMRLPLPR